MGTTIELNVTWPACRQVTVPLARRSECVCVVDGNFAHKEGSVVTVCRGFSNENRVLDVDRYRIDSDGSNVTLAPHCETHGDYELSAYNDFPPDDIHDDFQNTLVILLESPHKEEYVNNCLDDPIAPAQGQTGCNLHRWLGGIVCGRPHLRECMAGRTRVIVSNPVQFQASLAAVLRLLPSSGRAKATPITKRVWKRLWAEVKDDFMQRLSNYHPNFIINACTYELKEEVTRTLRERHGCISQGVLYEAGGHPSMWHMPSRRQLRWRSLAE